MEPNVFSPYAPVRLREQTWWAFAQEVARQGFVTPKGQIARQLPDMIMQELIMPMMKAAKQLAKQQGGEEALGQLMAKLLTQRQWVPLVAQYELAGKQIFDIDDEVVKMLRMTDVEDCLLDQWNAPYEAFFVRFGKQDDVKVQFDDSFEYLDGAFVAITPWDDEGTQRRLKIGLSTVKSDGSGVQMPGYFVDLTPEEQKLSPTQAVEAFITRKCAELDAEQGLDEKSQDLRELRKAEYREGANLLKDAVSLVVNSLFYIESMGADKPQRPGRDVPPQIVVAWHQAPAMRKFKASQKVTRDGYVMVHMLGDEPQAVSHSSVERLHDVATHWRRGHWRKQPHGPQMTLRKRVWIRPVMVNQGKSHEDLPGHVYAVGETPNAIH